MVKYALENDDDLSVERVFTTRPGSLTLDFHLPTVAFLPNSFRYNTYVRKGC